MSNIRHAARLQTQLKLFVDDKMKSYNLTVRTTATYSTHIHCSCVVISCNFGKRVSYLQDRACWIDFEAQDGSKLALFVSFPKQHIWWIMKDKEGTCTERQKPASLW
jgi:hypothetical protein